MPERKAYRNTCPTNIPGRGNSLPSNDIVSNQSSSSTGLSAEVTASSATQVTGSQTTSVEERENEFEGHFTRLESERTTWVRRRQGGSLDVTPPREERFERFLG